MIIAVYHGCKTTTQQQTQSCSCFYGPAILNLWGEGGAGGVTIAHAYNTTAVMYVHPSCLSRMKVSFHYLLKENFVLDSYFIDRYMYIIKISRPSLIWGKIPLLF